MLIADNFDKIYHSLYDALDHSKAMKVRGLYCKEIMNADFILTDPKDTILKRQPSSYYNYLEKEMEWYIKGDPDIKEISKHAKLWKDICPSGKANSNYGEIVYKQKIIWDATGDKFKPETQYDWCLAQLVKDKNSRQAIINYNQVKHKYEHNMDFVCTIAQHFLIRNNRLYSNIFMRSTDLIYGLRYDINWFSYVMLHLYEDLRRTYKKLKLGELYFFTSSLHIYKKHWRKRWTG